MMPSHAPSLRRTFGLAAVAAAMLLFDVRGAGATPIGIEWEWGNGAKDWKVLTRDTYPDPTKLAYEMMTRSPAVLNPDPRQKALLCTDKKVKNIPLLSVTYDNPNTLELATAPIEHTADTEWNEVLAFVNEFFITARLEHHKVAQTGKCEGVGLFDDEVQCEVKVEDLLVALNQNKLNSAVQWTDCGRPASVSLKGKTVTTYPVNLVVVDFLPSTPQRFNTQLDRHDTQVNADMPLSLAADADIKNLVTFGLKLEWDEWTRLYDDLLTLVNVTNKVTNRLAAGYLITYLRFAEHTKGVELTEENSGLVKNRMCLFPKTRLHQLFSVLPKTAQDDVLTMLGGPLAKHHPGLYNLLKAGKEPLDLDKITNPIAPVADPKTNRVTIAVEIRKAGCVGAVFLANYSLVQTDGVFGFVNRKAAQDVLTSVVPPP